MQKRLTSKQIVIVTGTLVLLGASGFFLTRPRAPREEAEAIQSAVLEGNLDYLAKYYDPLADSKLGMSREDFIVCLKERLQPLLNQAEIAKIGEVESATNSEAIVFSVKRPPYPEYGITLGLYKTKRGVFLEPLKILYHSYYLKYGQGAGLIQDFPTLQYCIYRGLLDDQALLKSLGITHIGSLYSYSADGKEPERHELQSWFKNRRESYRVKLQAEINARLRAAGQPEWNP